MLRSSQAEQVEVIHWLNTAAESAAIQHVADKVEALGSTWVEIVPPDGNTGAQALFSSRIGGGDPPGAMFGSIGKQAQDLGEQGILRDIRSFADAEGLVDTVPQFALEIVSGPEGQLYAVPLAVETQNFIWYSVPVFEAAGLQPPATWVEFLEQAPALAEAGFIPIAVGAQGWQLNILHFSILGSLLGKDRYMAFYGDQDADVGASPEIAESFRILRELSLLADDGSANRGWTETLGLVANGQAGIFVMGSWAGGELAALGHEYGTDWGCAIAGGDTWIVGSTGFMIPDLGRDSQGQDDFIRAQLDPATQTAFSIDKGSIPTRTDADTSVLTECSQMVAQGMAEDRGVANASAIVSSDASGQVTDLIVNFWSNTAILPEDAAAQFAGIILNDF
ncbi:MAG: extracellular solute-binding protein [Rubellimicrobium sp.]|nr:extracellular solute-binding protein [Rubellimicrobium sp.]